MVGSSTKGGTAEVFDKIAEHFDLTRKAPWREVVDFISRLGSIHLAADIGCGNGRHIPFLTGKSERVVAVDSSKAMLSVAERNIDEAGIRSRVEFVQADSSRLPLGEEVLGGFLYIAALHHLPTKEDRIASLDSLMNALMPKARGLISVWSLDQPRFEDLAVAFADGDIMVPWTMPDGSRVDRFYHLFLEDEFKSLIEQSGLQVERIYRSKENYYAEVASY